MIYFLSAKRTRLPTNFNSLQPGVEYSLHGVSGHCKGSVTGTQRNKVLKIENSKCSGGFSLDAFMKQFYSGVELVQMTRGRCESTLWS